VAVILGAMEERARDSVAFSHMAYLAALSVVVLIGISGWQAYKFVATGNPVSAANGEKELSAYAESPWKDVNWQAPSGAGIPTNDPDGLSNIEGNVADALLTSYVALSQAGIYTPEDGTEIAEDIAASLKANVSSPVYAQSDIKTDSDTSYQRMLAYRNDLRVALEPLLKNPGYEFGIFANYIESRDALYTDQLKETAANYRQAAENAAAITVPVDAAERHLAILNSLSEFGATIAAMATHADDAFASAALIGTYNSNEKNLLLAFDALASYQREKPL
jgi:hypothetical protein